MRSPIKTPRWVVNAITLACSDGELTPLWLHHAGHNAPWPGGREELMRDCPSPGPGPAQVLLHGPRPGGLLWVPHRKVGGAGPHPQSQAPLGESSQDQHGPPRLEPLAPPAAHTPSCLPGQPFLPSFSSSS
jgi:hypothetical protein